MDLGFYFSENSGLFAKNKNSKTQKRAKNNMKHP
jgi:hypothetical protein